MKRFMKSDKSAVLGESVAFTECYNVVHVCGRILMVQKKVGQ